MRRLMVLSCLLLLGSGILFGQEKDPTQERLKALEERIAALEAEVKALKANQPASPPEAEAATSVPVPAPAASTAAPAAAPEPAPQAASAAASTTPGQLPVYGGLSAASKVLNPDISVIGDFLGAVGRDPNRSVPTLEMHESEVGFQAIVDPYARADFFLTFGEQGVNLEEGYLTFTALPGGFVGKVGKMRSAFGIVNTLHNHVLPWTDRPLATENLVGGEDGINDAGLSVSRILPAPKDIFLEATAQVFRGDSGDVFHSTRRGDVLTVGHLRAYRDLTESTNLDLGASWARGHNDVGTGFRTQLFGANATLRWKPLRRAVYHSFLFRNEFFWSRREQLDSTQRAFGFYTAADYRLNQRWTIGGRYDRSGRADMASLTDSGFSPVITYWPSEFSQIRGQYRFTRYADGRSGNDFFMQFLFVLGAHGAHPF
ncbi:MAG: hypothetical protein LAO07_06605 [Acidobacteriia bacterium]|nr:hypothetical protein [Terriglobia bacterium]